MISIFYSHLLCKSYPFLTFSTIMHTMQYTEYVSKTCTLETYIISLTKGNPINLIKMFQGIKLQKYFRNHQDAQKSSVNVFTLTRLTAKSSFSRLLPFYANLSVHLFSSFSEQISCLSHTDRIATLVNVMKEKCILLFKQILRILVFIKIVSWCFPKKKNLQL